MYTSTRTAENFYFFGDTPQGKGYAVSKKSTDYIPFGQVLPNRNGNTPEYRYGFNSKEKDDEIKQSSGTSYDFGARLYDPRVGRWLTRDPLAGQYPSISPYTFVGNMPIIAIDPDGKRIFFIAGAGNDDSGWGYVNRFKNAFSKTGISGFKRINASHGKLGDMVFVDYFRNKSNVGTRAGIVNVRDDQYFKKAYKDIVTDLKNNPLKEGEQLNLTGYSYGAVMQVHIAIKLIEEGYKIDNLILIAVPIQRDSDLFKKLEAYEKSGKIKKLIIEDIPGDKLSTPKSDEYVDGGLENSSDDGHHFDLARPGVETDKRIRKFAKKLVSKGVK